ncbi:hypothetical protein niasHS_014283 [Heterodera schachtii]|uniref:Peptidase M12B domain-containing protein n=1 Tax=Heterodera schachtii TaxID=97005 RepID=A0ABD2INH6_HETSC
MYKHIYGKQGSDHAKTRSAIRTTMRDLVKGVNNIYENTDFHRIKGINFAIQRTTVYAPETCVVGVGGFSKNPFCAEDMDAYGLVHALTKTSNSTTFCLVYLLMHRDLHDNKWGRAWQAAPSDNDRGICQRNNTGFVTLINEGEQATLLMSKLTLAHEFGHSLGSPSTHSRRPPTSRIWRQNKSLLLLHYV